ncbi:MAG: hypothetical protein HYR67_14280 [Bacteroidetes bacterium]|nr:hypothetical protein [Bacteroidota bacterium]
MDLSLKYVPIFRGRKEELKVIQSFDFGDHIYPCLEIIKNSGKKTFSDNYLHVIGRIKAKKILVDLPLYLNQGVKRKEDTTKFLTFIRSRENRTALIKSLNLLADRIIPVISSYAHISGEPQSVIKQSNDLRPKFPVLAFRTFLNSFNQDKDQILSCIQPSDYLIMDWEDHELDETDLDMTDIVNALANFKCTVIINRNPFPKDFKNTSIVHGEKLKEINNDHTEVFRKFGGNCFSDFAGIKKDDISEGGTISPGFIYYDAVNNEFYGYRYKNGSHKKGERRPELSEFETRIVPDIIKSDATERMQGDVRNYLDSTNDGWNSLNKINSHELSGRNQALFKWIGMQHYISCIKAKINHGDFT